MLPLNVDRRPLAVNHPNAEFRSRFNCESSRLAVICVRLVATNSRGEAILELLGPARSTGRVFSLAPSSLFQGW